MTEFVRNMQKQIFFFVIKEKSVPKGSGPQAVNAILIRLTSAFFDLHTLDLHISYISQNKIYKSLQQLTKLLLHFGSWQIYPLLY